MCQHIRIVVLVLWLLVDDERERKLGGWTCQKEWREVQHTAEVERRSERCKYKYIPCGKAAGRRLLNVGRGVPVTNKSIEGCGTIMLAHYAPRRCGEARSRQDEQINDLHLRSPSPPLPPRQQVLHHEREPSVGVGLVSQDGHFQRVLQPPTAHRQRLLSSKFSRLFTVVRQPKNYGSRALRTVLSARKSGFTRGPSKRVCEKRVSILASRVLWARQF